MKKFLIIFIFLFIMGFIVINKIIFPLNYKNQIINYSKKYNIKPEIVASLICAESGFNKNAISNKGAMGLMQLIPSTAKWVYSQIYETDFSNDLLFNEEINIEIGCFYLNYLNNKFSNLECVLCAYNAGETVVREWLRNNEYSNDGVTLKLIPYNETKNYVKKIKNYIKVYALKFK